MVKRVVPKDFGDFLAILSFLGFVGIFLEFVLEKTYLSESMTPLFLIVGGIGLMVVGRVFSIVKWASDGIQKNEVSQLFSGIFGVSAVVVGLLLWSGKILPLTVQGFVGFIALAPASFILIEYLARRR